MHCNVQWQTTRYKYSFDCEYGKSLTENVLETPREQALVAPNQCRI